MLAWGFGSIQSGLSVAAALAEGAHTASPRLTVHKGLAPGPGGIVGCIEGLQNAGNKAEGLVWMRIGEGPKSVCPIKLARPGPPSCPADGEGSYPLFSRML